MHKNENLPAVIHPHVQYVAAHPASYAMPAPAQPDAEGLQAGIPLAHYLWILRRRWWQLLGFVAACVTATLITSLRLTPVYEATATIDVDRQSPPGIIGQEATRATLNDSDQFLATQVRLLQSDSVLRPVVQKYNLLQHEGAIDPNDPSSVHHDAPIKLKKLKVSRPPNTYLLLVSYRSPDPTLASNAVNSIAQSYIQHTFNLRYKASASLSSFMEKQLEELKAKMEHSTAALAQFERELNVINPEEKTSILSSRLLQLNTEYTNAQSDRVRKEAASRSLSSGSMESALASQQGDSLRKLLESYNDAQQKFATIRGQYGSRHPEHRKVAGHVAEIQRQLEVTRKTIAQRVDVEFAEASSREHMLHKAVAETKAEFDKLNARQFEYQQLKREAETDKKLYDELVRRIKEAGINASFQNSSIRMADAARPPVKPVFPNIPFNVGLAFLFSSVLAVGAAMLIDVLDNTVRDPEAVTRELNTPVVGALPSVKNWRKRLTTTVALAQTEDNAVSNFAESIRTLRNSILLADFDRRLRTLLVTSASPAEGKSTTAAHLALAHAEQGKRTLLIDGDLRRPSAHRKFGFNPTAGLSSVLLREVEWRQVLVRIEAAPNLDILPAGPPSRRASDLISSGMDQLIEEMAQEYDLVIIDAPPLLGFAEPLQMATRADGVLIVARAGETKRKAIGSVIGSLRRLNVNVVGLVLNEVKKDHSDSYYYYGYYGKYYASPAPEQS
jgi:polysaccharide biosynthesis transport protein